MSNSYDWSMMLLATLFAGVLFISLGYGINTFIDYMNNGIGNGVISEQTSTHFNAGIKLWFLLPLFALFDIMLWAINRSQSENGG